MRYDKEHLLSLIPAIYKLRDALSDDQPKGPLDALIGAIATQISGVELNIEQLYDDLFIETCADWVVPYLGDLIGYTSLSGSTANVRSPRAEVANTISYRRRKGTLTVLEMLAADVTGWPALAKESFQGLAQTQHVRHLRPSRTWTASMRSPLPALADNQIFLDLPHTVDVRQVSTGRGLWNIPNIAITLYRLAVGSISGGTPGVPSPVNPNRMSFDPLGRDVPLFQPVRGPAADQAHTDLPQNMPSRASRRLLYAELEQRRALLAKAVDPAVIEEEAVGFTALHPVFRIVVDGTPIDPEFIAICNLSDWTPSAVPGIQASVDPALGRFMLANATPSSVLIDYAYGSPGPFGAGGYVRPNAPAITEVTSGDSLSGALATALTASKADVRVSSSATFAGDLTITLDPGQTLTLRAASFMRPVIGGTLTIILGDGSALKLSGFLISGGVRIDGGQGSVAITGCTMPAAPDLAVGSSPPPALTWGNTGGGTLALASTLSGPLIVDALLNVSVTDSIINAGSDSLPAISADAGASAGALSLESTTVVGMIAVREIGLVQNSLITGSLSSTRTQGGCVRFSYLGVRLHHAAPIRVPARHRHCYRDGDCARCGRDQCCDCGSDHGHRHTPATRFHQS
ncbi:hypothetical protein [Terriglobus roseus]|uniref:hypothetical protein n=1 Tax=Terriglobus roseus TaxID=392734 RepID=UPI0003091D0C|nr:hypothetical protein [Terriglobus roseus]